MKEEKCPNWINVHDQDLIPADLEAHLNTDYALIAFQHFLGMWCSSFKLTVLSGNIQVGYSLAICSAHYLRFFFLSSVMIFKML